MRSMVYEAITRPFVCPIMRRAAGLLLSAVRRTYGRDMLIDSGDLSLKFFSRLKILIVKNSIIIIITVTVDYKLETKGDHLLNVNTLVCL